VRERAPSSQACVFSPSQFAKCQSCTLPTAVLPGKEGGFAAYFPSQKAVIFEKGARCTVVDLASAWRFSALENGVVLSGSKYSVHIRIHLFPGACQLYCV
jgi:hypothetical protein